MPLGLSTCMYNDILNRISIHLLLITACTIQNTEHENATQAFVVRCATSAVELSVLTTQFKWSLIIARETIIIISCIASAFVLINDVFSLLLIHAKNIADLRYV